MRLAEQLGSFAGQMTERGIETVTLEYEGAVAELNVKPLTAIALTALLGRSIGSVNMGNVGVVCRERNIRISETTPAEPADYQTLIPLAVPVDERDHIIPGTFFRRAQPRPLRLQGIPA